MVDYEPSPSTLKPDWQQKFEAALLEVDPQKLRQLVDATEAAIFSRLQSLDGSADGVERHALDDARHMLRTIQKKELGYPDWKGI